MLTEQLIDDLAYKMEAVPPAPPPARIFLTWLGAATIYILIVLFFMDVRPDFISRLHSLLYVLELITLSGIMLSSLGCAAFLAFPDMYQKKRLALLPIASFLLFILVMMAAFVADSPPAPSPPHAMECLLCITLLSLIPGTCVLYSIRKYASTHYYAAGCVAVLAAFSLGSLVLRISEETDSIAHVIEWHYLPMIGVGVIGLFLGKLCLKW